jgi:type II secretory pathway component GspD/PulD (secretin)
MKTVQRSWRRSLAGLVLAAALAAGDAATRAGQPPAAAGPTGAGKMAAKSPEEKRLRRRQEDIDAELSRLTKELEGATTKEKIGELRVRIDELQEEKAQLEAPRKALQDQQTRRHIKAFRLKQANPQEVGEVLARLLAPEGGYYFLRRSSSPGPRANPPGDRRGSRGPAPGPEGEAPPPEVPGLPELPGGMGRSSRPRAGPEQGWNFTVDRRTNSLIVRGTQHDLQVAADLAAVLDAPPGSALPPVKSLRGFRLKFASPREVADILRQLNLHDARVVALEKSSLLLVMASDADLDEIGDLVKDLDVEARGPSAGKR